MNNNRKENLSILEDFVNKYNREFDFYNTTSLLAAQLIENQLIIRGIRAIVTSRAKNPTRLKDKLTKRAIEEEKTMNTLKIYITI